LKQRLIAFVWLACSVCAPGSAQAANQFQVDTRYVHTMGNQTVVEVVRSLFPDQQRYWKEITQEFVRINPHAFNARSQLLPGVRMQVPKHLPTVARISALSGEAWAVDFTGARRTLDGNQPIHLGDRLITGAPSPAGRGR